MICADDVPQTIPILKIADLETEPKAVVVAQLAERYIPVWTEPLCLNLLGPGNGHVTYLSRFPEPIPKNSL